MITQTPRKIKLELMSNEIESIIDELSRTSHNIYEHLEYDKIVKKLRRVQNDY